MSGYSQKYISETIYGNDYKTAAQILSQEIGADPNAIFYILNAADANGRSKAYSELAGYAKDQLAYISGYKSGTLKER